MSIIFLKTGDIIIYFVNAYNYLICYMLYVIQVIHIPDYPSAKFQQAGQIRGNISHSNDIPSTSSCETDLTNDVQDEDIQDLEKEEVHILGIQKMTYYSYVHIVSNYIVFILKGTNVFS